MSKERDKITEALEDMSIKFDELGFSPTIPIPKGDKAHFVDWFKFEIDTINVVSNKQAQRIAELEEQLKNVIVPKFKVGQEVWYIDRYGVQKDIIVSFTYFSIENEILYKMHDEIIDHREKYIFATKEEAQVKLEELEGEK